jgi:hypothetical protein
MTDTDNFRPEDPGHPRGTLAIVILYGLLFGLAWLGLYFYVFLPRGLISVPRSPTPSHSSVLPRSSLGSFHELRAPAAPSGDSAPAGGLRTPPPLEGGR